MAEDQSPKRTHALEVNDCEMADSRKLKCTPSPPRMKIRIKPPERPSKKRKLSSRKLAKLAQLAEYMLQEEGNKEALTNAIVKNPGFESMLFNLLEKSQHLRNKPACKPPHKKPEKKSTIPLPLIHRDDFSVLSESQIYGIVCSKHPEFGYWVEDIIQSFLETSPKYKSAYDAYLSARDRKTENVEEGLKPKPVHMDDFLFLLYGKFIEKEEVFKKEVCQTDLSKELRIPSHAGKGDFAIYGDRCAHLEIEGEDFVVRNFWYKKEVNSKYLLGGEGWKNYVTAMDMQPKSIVKVARDHFGNLHISSAPPKHEEEVVSIAEEKHETVEELVTDVPAEQSAPQFTMPEA